MTYASQHHARKLPTGRPNVPTYVYRCYDAAGRLLYVGRSNQPATRITAHRTHAWWGDRIATVRFTVFPNRAKAAEMEGRAIYDECPIANTKGRWRQGWDRGHWALADYQSYCDALGRAYPGEVRDKAVAEAVAEARSRFGVELLRKAA